jgi:hypothetical protein
MAQTGRAKNLHNLVLGYRGTKVDSPLAKIHGHILQHLPNILHLFKRIMDAKLHGNVVKRRLEQLFRELEDGLLRRVSSSLVERYHHSL